MHYYYELIRIFLLHHVINEVMVVELDIDPSTKFGGSVELGGSVIYFGGFVGPGSISLWAQASRSDLDRSKIDGRRSWIRI